MKRLDALYNQQKQDCNFNVYDTLLSPRNIKNRIYMHQKIKNLNTLINDERKVQNDNHKSR